MLSCDCPDCLTIHPHYITTNPCLHFAAAAAAAAVVVVVMSRLSNRVCACVMPVMCTMAMAIATNAPHFQGRHVPSECPFHPFIFFLFHSPSLSFFLISFHPLLCTLPSALVCSFFFRPCTCTHTHTRYPGADTNKICSQIHLTNSPHPRNSFSTVQYRIPLSILEIRKGQKAN